MAVVTAGWWPSPCVPPRAQPAGGVPVSVSSPWKGMGSDRTKSPKTNPAASIDFPGACYLRGRGCDLHPGGVGVSGPRPEDAVLGGDAGDLQAPGVSG